MPHRPYLQLDVFAERPGNGNPLAVVLDADGLTDEAMQAIARWTRLPETTFVMAADAAGASYRVTKNRLVKLALEARRLRRCRRFSPVRPRSRSRTIRWQRQRFASSSPRRTRS